MALSDWSFAVFILTHGRPDTVITDATLRRSGYTGLIYYLVDNEDSTTEKYRARYGNKVIEFDKKKYADMIDEGDNFDKRVTITHVRNAAFDIAEQLGVEFFIELDDDYQFFEYRTNRNEEYPIHQCRLTSTLDRVFEQFLVLYKSTSFASLAFSQGGDFIGGRNNKTTSGNPTIYRKCMNSFICSPKRRFQFVGRLNEDVNTYCTLGSRGLLFGTIPLVSLTQKATQSQSGGITGAYKEGGTYVKSFYTVMMCPSFVKVAMMGDTHERLHHAVSWNNAVPKIVSDNLASSSARQKHYESKVKKCES